MKTDKFTLFVYDNFLVFYLVYNRLGSQNINKQIVNIAADETLIDYNFSHSLY